MATRQGHANEIAIRMYRVGFGVLMGGTGSEWAVSAFLMPAAAFIGAALGGRLADRRE